MHAGPIDYQRFLTTWIRVHSADSDALVSASVINYRDMQLDIPSPALLSSSRSVGGVATVLPPLSDVSQDRDESVIR
jgi:hypothetical protein